MMNKKILGDFQTPLPLARQVLSTLSRDSSWSRLLEPTCGIGNFLRAALEELKDIHEIVGIELQEACVHLASAIDSSGS